MEIFSTKPNANGIAETLGQGAGGSVLPTSMNAFAGILQKAGARFEGDMAALIGKTTLADSPERAAETVAGDNRSDGRRDKSVSEKHANDGRASDRSDNRPDTHRADRNDDHGRDRASSGDNEHNEVKPGERGEHQARNDDAGRDRDTADRSADGQEAGKANSNSGDANSAGENDGGQQSAPGDGEQSGTETTATETSDGSALAVSGVRHAEQVLNGLLEIAQASAAAAQGTGEATSRAASKGPGENANQGLTTALNALVGQASAQGANGNNAHAQQQSPQAKADPMPNVNANAEALARTQVETGGNANNGAAQQAAGLARLIGQGNRISVQVNVTDESASLVSKPGSSLSASVVTSSQSTNEGRTGTQSNPNNGQPGATMMASQASENAAASINPAQGQQTTTQSMQAQSLAASASQAKGPAHASVNPNGAATLPQAVGGEAGASTMPGQTGETQQSRQAAAAQAANTARPSHPGQSVVEQVSVQITKALQAGVDKINIQLKPESMGRVEVRLELAQDGRVTAIVTADNKDTLEALQRDAKGLEKALLDAGLNTNSGDLSFNLRGENAHAGDDGSAGTGHAASPGAAAEAEGEDLEAFLSAGYDEGIGADGRVNIQV